MHSLVSALEKGLDLGDSGDAVGDSGDAVGGSDGATDKGN